ncbi:acyl-CoA dehydrogenase family protein [Aeromicrobium wangtongii]|uniref:acyl-CoA dehydrogenase family protein n=1 Tax=Aeromicrobium wangtongii TaxID=2969247 RepID=UPI002017977E|nr:acyl-CoA dehydrogenase family protein [Aeromicrobium wangtongii]MCL3819857.1 acyl-CoA dehydrogenase family protein [Aeromicrobium wangtongii]
MVDAVYGDDAGRRAADAPSGCAGDDVAWLRTGSEFGLIGLHLAEHLGGQDQPFGVQAAVVSSLGRRLAPSPHLPVIAFALPLLAHGTSSEQRDRLLPRVLAGEVVVAVAGLVPVGYGQQTGRLRIVDTTDGVVVDGAATDVIQAGDADLLLVVDGARVACLNLDAPGLDVVPLETLDLTRQRFQVQADGVPGELLGSVDEALIRRVVVQATALAAADSVAGARACLDAAVEYATLRVQFDQPIGSFQAVQHALADLFGEVVAAEASVAAAVEAVSTSDDPASDDTALELAQIAKVAASEAFSRAARESIHLHGGIGFTWEHDAHLFYRRALTDRPLLGDPTLHRRALARAFVAASAASRKENS